MHKEQTIAIGGWAAVYLLSLLLREPLGQSFSEQCVPQHKPSSGNKLYDKWNACNNSATAERAEDRDSIADVMSTTSPQQIHEQHLEV